MVSPAVSVCVCVCRGVCKGQQVCAGRRVRAGMGCTSPPKRDGMRERRARSAEQQNSSKTVAATAHAALHVRSVARAVAARRSHRPVPTRPAPATRPLVRDKE